jgi:hypothetical protein
VLDRATDYLANPQRSYRDVAGDGRLPIFYESQPSQPCAMGSSVAAPPGARSAIDERRLSHVTIWRWVGWLGTLRTLLRTALELIRQKDPRSTLHREVCAVPAHKYRTAARRTLLEHALRLLLAAAVFRRLFTQELFPYFATADGGG